MIYFFFEYSDWIAFGIGACLGATVCGFFIWLAWHHAATAYEQQIADCEFALRKTKRANLTILAENDHLRLELDTIYNNTGPIIPPPQWDVEGTTSPTVIHFDGTESPEIPRDSQDAAPPL